MHFGGQKELGRGFKMRVEGDSKLVIDALKVFCTIPWQLRNIIEDIKWLASSFDSIFFVTCLQRSKFLGGAITNT